MAPTGDVAPPGAVATPRPEAPPPVHHDVFPRAEATPYAQPQSRAAQPQPPVQPKPRPTAGHRAARRRPSRAPRPSRDPDDTRTSGLAWLPYLVVLAGVAAGMLIASRGSKYAGWGTGLVGASLLAAALARLVLPARYAGLLSSRRKASDALAFAVFGTAVLAVALTLP